MSADILQQLITSKLALTQHIPEGQVLFSAGNPCEHYVVVQSGTVRVELLSSAGQQLLLYRIDDGQSCVMTTSCLLGNSQYFAQAISETPVDLLMMTQATFRQQLLTSEPFRAFVFSGFHERFAHLMNRTAELATQSIDQRLAAALLAYTESLDGNPIERTHQQLAIDIGSAREVVSRRLAVFEEKGVIEKTRGAITLKNITKLRELLALN